MQETTYVIRGGVEGRERLRVLSRVMRPTTLGLFDRIGLRPAMRCLDAGCGGGDVAFDLARAVGAGGKVVGVDIDETQLELARREAESLGLGNLEFRQAEIGGADLEPAFDVAYARFLLSHLNDPLRALATMRQALRPGGVLVVEDIDFTGHFCHPGSAAFQRYVELYTQAVQRGGADPNIGPRLPGLLIDAGCGRVGMNVVQPAGMEGEVKLVTPITMENIADAVLGAGLASSGELDEVIVELYAFARNPRTVMSLPRVVQAWGYRKGDETS
jgi:predicted O-methyltransferase YrrM